MSFDSLTYVVFLALTVVVYWRLNRERQNLFLVLASLLFYGWWDWRFLGLLCATTLIDYFLSHALDRSPNESARKTMLVISLSVNLLVLGFFKYFNFFADSMVEALAMLGVTPGWTFIKVVLPIGVSFYTFEAIAYMVEVYRRQIVPARTLRDYALFITFFPHLVAGPIMRPHVFLPQCDRERKFRRRQFVHGLDLICWGMVKKLIISDSVAYYVDRLFNLSQPSTLLIVVAGIGFWIQILADFSGYTDIARGSSKLLGFELSHNFYAPYSSRSIGEFWRRWHVSLSSWIRDFLYIPLGGSRVSRPRYIFNVLVTWTLCGFWHGAAWKFLAWGFFHGLLLLAERLRAPQERRRGLEALLATNVLVIVGWIIFRTPSMGKLAQYVGVDALVRSSYDFQAAYVLLTIYAFYSLPWLLKIAWTKAVAFRGLTSTQRWEARAAWYAFSLGAIALFAKLHSSAFIYFEF